MGSFLPLILLFSFGNLLLVVQGDHHSHLATKLQVSEHGIHYNETLSLNPDEQVVTVHVPAHHDLDEHFTAMHEPSRTSLTYFPQHSLCELTTVSKSLQFEPLRLFMSVVGADARQMTVSPEVAKTVYHATIERGVASPSDLAHLPASMRQLCKGLPIKRSEQIQITEEEHKRGFIKIPGALDRVNNRLKKRSIRCPLTTILFVGKVGRLCLWTVCDHLKLAKDCVTHIQSGKYSEVMCCSSGTNPGLCGCDEIEECEREKSRTQLSALVSTCQRKLEPYGIYSSG